MLTLYRGRGGGWTQRKSNKKVGIIAESNLPWKCQYLDMKQQQAKIESGALYFGGAVWVLAVAVALAWFWGQVVPLFGRGSIGAVASVLAAAAAFAGVLLTYRPVPGYRPGLYRRARQWLTDGALALTHAGIALLLVAVAYYLGQAAFEGLQFDQWTAAALAGTTVAVAGYTAYLSGVRLTTSRLSATLAIFLVTGAMASMVSAPNPYWWQIHFSSLGGGHSASAAAFNLTLLIGGLVVVGLADLIASDFQRWQAARPGNLRVKTGIIRLVMALIGVSLACVGLFPYDTHLSMHNLAAYGMGLLFYGLIGALVWLAPGLPKAFYGFSYTLLAALLAFNWLWLGVGYLNLTAFELLTAGTIFAWLVVFVRQISAGLVDAGKKTA